MENIAITEKYQIKRPTEYWLFFKYLKLAAIFIGTYAGCYILILIITRKKLINGEPMIGQQYFEQINTIIIVVSFIVVLYYLYTRLKNNEIIYIEFIDKTRTVFIKYRNYITHITYIKSYAYNDFAIDYFSDEDFINGEYEHIDFYSNNKVVAVIDGTSIDWQKMPNTLNRLKDKIISLSTAGNRMVYAIAGSFVVSAFFPYL